MGTRCGSAERRLARVGRWGVSGSEIPLMWVGACMGIVSSFLRVLDRWPCMKFCFPKITRMLAFRGPLAVIGVTYMGIWGLWRLDPPRWC